MEAKLVFSHLAVVVLLLCFSTVALSATDDEESTFCVYTIFVRTSKTFFGGTDSKISVNFYDSTGDGIQIKDLETWGGIMEKGHDYFEMGNLDIFTGRAPCLSGPICAMDLTSDGNGFHHDWYCNYVEVTATGLQSQTHCAQVTFTVEQWLSRFIFPWQLTVTRDKCSTGALNHRPLGQLSPVETLLAGASSSN